ncbi:hypothetical protein ACQKQA_16145 [Pseudomonas sp. NPDC089530]|uniref:hypothetical protein n=1 Tax=Pseudomonas sp. NPDC089530 TaxID=3390651 RepID=UPI003D064887
MLNYAYSDGDLLENPQTYRYSSFQGAAFVDAWRASRLATIARLPAPALPALPPQGPAQAEDSTALLSQLCLEMRAGAGVSGPLASYWLPRLLKKFEVSKRLYAGYEAGAPHRPLPHSDYGSLQPYLLLAECMLQGWQASGAAYYLSGLLKLTDTLVSQHGRLEPDQGAYLAWLLTQEQQVLATVAQEAGL